MKDLQVFKTVHAIRHIESLVSPHQGNGDTGHLNQFVSGETGLSACKGQG